MNVLRHGLVVSSALIFTGLLGGCALAMLNGASNSGGSGSASGGSGSTTSSSSQTAARKAADDSISTSVRSRFAANATLKTLKLTVDTHDGVVTLRGQAARVEQRNAAQTEALAVKGVKSVQNLIVVR